MNALACKVIQVRTYLNMISVGDILTLQTLLIPGIRCEMEMNECASVPCKNGGTCQDAIGKFMCYCNVGFFGDDCGIVGKYKATSSIDDPLAVTAQYFYLHLPLIASKGACYEDTTLGKYGQITWPQAVHSTIVNKSCPYGPAYPGQIGLAFRPCKVINNAVVWGEPDHSNCKEVRFHFPPEISVLFGSSSLDLDCRSVFLHGCHFSWVQLKLRDSWLN